MEIGHSTHSIQRMAKLTADEASVPECIFLMLLLRPQVCKRVDNDSKNEIEEDNNDDKVEDEVVENPDMEEWLLE
jgi:hypothetical protein